MKDYDQLEAENERLRRAAIRLCESIDLVGKYVPDAYCSDSLLLSNIFTSQEMMREVLEQEGLE